MFALLVMVHILVCLVLILFVLLQSGKAADLAGAFGGGGSQTAFGARGAQTFLSKMTTASAVTFMLTSLALGIISTRKTRSLIEDLPAETAVEETGIPAPAGAGPFEDPLFPPVEGSGETPSGEDVPGADPTDPAAPADDGPVNSGSN